MPIKHLVIGGGGPLGLRFLGALEKLEEDNFWKIENIESIYGTSVGALIGTFFCLNYDWETLNKYIIERPWHEAFKINTKQIFDSYYNKGLFDRKFTEIIFKPLLQAKDLSLNITLEEFYQFSKIDFHIFTFDINKFETIELSHTSHPELELLQALTMSSALPGIFMPVIIDKCCYVDGGVMQNFPLNPCIRDHSNHDEILGIKSSYDKKTDNDNFKNVEVTSESSLLEYVVCFTLNTMNFIRDTVKIANITNTVKCYVSSNPLTMEAIQGPITNQDVRKQWIKQGEEDAIEFLTGLTNKQTKTY